MAKGSSLEGFYIATKKIHPQRVLVTPSTLPGEQGLMVEERQVYDPGLQQWMTLERVKRPKYQNRRPSAVLLFGDESRQEVEENVEMGMDSEKERWFRNLPGRDWEAVFRMAATQRLSQAQADAQRQARLRMKMAIRRQRGY